MFWLELNFVARYLKFGGASPKIGFQEIISK